jgi:hypothetical protein
VVLETFCFMCGKSVLTTDDDDAPRCEKCQGEWAEVLAIQAIMDGEIPTPEQETEDREEDDDGDD